MGGCTWLSRTALMPNGMCSRHRPVAPVIWGEQATAATTRPATLPCSPSAGTGRRERAGSLGRVPRDEADGTVSGPSLIGSILAHLPPDACSHFHWVQRWERASCSRPNSPVLLFSARDHRPPRGNRPVLAGTKGLSRVGLRREPQPEGAPSLLEPAERRTGNPTVAAPLQVPAGRFRTERSSEVGDDAALPVLPDPLDGLPASTLTLDGGRRLAELAQPRGPLKLDRSARRPGRARAAPAPGQRSARGRGVPASWTAVSARTSRSREVALAIAQIGRRGLLIADISPATPHPDERLPREFLSQV
jgi:hypothetical protein